jgi:SAM-dependent methyltransferase
MADADWVDWRRWHEKYDEPGSSLARRLAVVQDRITRVLDAAGPGEIRILSLCAGEGRDLLGALQSHPRRLDVRARLVELDPELAARARRRAAALDLDAVDVVTGDAALTDHYLALVPADLVLVCGVFGNIDAADIERTIGHCAALCRPGGTVVWTRNRREPDQVPLICDWFAQNGFTLDFVTEPDDFGVGAHRHTGQARRPVPGATMFTFDESWSLHDRGC